MKRKRLRKRELKRLLKMQGCARRWLSRRRSKEKDAHSHVLFRTILDELLMQGASGRRRRRQRQRWRRGQRAHVALGRAE